MTASRYENDDQNVRPAKRRKRRTVEYRQGEQAERAQMANEKRPTGRTARGGLDQTGKHNGWMRTRGGAECKDEFRNLNHHSSRRDRQNKLRSHPPPAGKPAR